MSDERSTDTDDRAGLPPCHLVRWAPADYLGSKVRLRAMRTGDSVLRFFYPELLNVLYTQGGSVTAADLVELLSLPVEEVMRCATICVELRSVVMTYRECCESDPQDMPPGAVVLTNPRVLRELETHARLRERRALGGGAGAKYGALGGRPKTKPLEGLDPFRGGRVREQFEGSGDLSKPRNPKPIDPTKPLEGLHVTPSGIGIGIGNGVGKGKNNGSGSALAVLTYWTARSKTSQRSERVTELVLKRISARIKDGFTVEDLCAAVDAACASEFYVERGYHKQPDVVFRNAERVQSLLARRETAKAHRAAEQSVATPEEAARVERRRQACKDNPRQKGETIEAYRGRIDAVLA